MAKRKGLRAQERYYSSYAPKPKAKPKPWRPSVTQLAQARAQERAYRSQGKAVQRVAEVQKRYGPGVATRGPSLRAAKTRRRKQRRAEVKRVRRQIQRQARQTERYYSTFGKSAQRKIGPPTPLLSTRVRNLRIQQAQKGLRSFERGGLLPDRSARSVPELSRDIRLLSQDVRTQIKTAPRERLYEAQGAREDVKRAGSPVIGALEQLARPIYGIAAGSKAAIKGENVPKAVGRGVTLKEKTLFSDVLKEAGVPSLGGGRSVAGFLLDVGLDPTTYLTLGTSTAARQAATKAAASAARSAAETQAKLAIAKGVPKAQAKKQVREAAREAGERVLARAERSQKGKGVEVRFAGKRVPGTRRATAAVGRGVGRAARPVTKRTEGARRAVRKVGSEVHAGVRAPTVNVSEEALAKALKREQRSKAERTIRDIDARVNALLGKFSDDEARQIIDAIETGKLGSLRGAQPLKGRSRAALRRRGRVARRDPDRLFIAAQNIRSDLRYLERVGRRSQLLAGRVGPKARSRAEVELSARATPVRSTTRLRSELRTAEQSFQRARQKLKLASTPKARANARAALTASSRRVTNLRKQIAAAERTSARSVKARTERREIRQTRKRTEAQGYFPRIKAADIKGTKLLEQINDPAMRAIEAVGSNRPMAGAAKFRTHRRARAKLPAEIAEPLSTDIRQTVSTYGRTIARASSARELNTKLVQQGRKLPKNLDRAGIKAIKEGGERIYRVRRGILEDVTDRPDLLTKVSRQRPPTKPKKGLGLYAERPTAKEIKLAEEQGRAPRIKSTATEAGGQYVVLRPELVERVRARAPSSSEGLAPAVAAVFDRYRSGFKGLALATPAYLVRNLLGDLANAYGDESAFRLARNFLRGQKALNELGRYERAQGRFYRSLPKGKRTVKLTEDQGRQVAKAFGMKTDGIAPTEVSAMQVARLAEQMGVVRQGRFLELLEEGGRFTRPKGTSAWQNVTKRVEDSTRIATFLGGLQRGMNPREAAARASKIHFDYGDLTAFEKRVLRRVAPFYTFTARNIPLQARYLATRPGKLATVEKAREEARKAAGLPEDYAEGLDEYEALQAPFPVKLGDRTQTVSFGSPWTDLNAVVGGPDQWAKKALEISGGPEKLLAELAMNYSLFYRDEIEPSESPEVRAPEWAQTVARISPGWAKQVGIQPFVDSEGNETLGWGRKTDYTFRNLEIGPIGAILRLPGLGTKTASARGMTPTQQLLTTGGIRTKDYKPAQAELTRLYREGEKVRERMNRLNSRPHPTERQSNGRPYLINAEHPTPEYERLSERNREIERRKDELNRQLKPHGFVKGRPVAPPSKGGLPTTGGKLPVAKTKLPTAQQRLPVIPAR